MSEWNEERTCDLLPMYYNRLFPYKQFYNWLSYGDKEYFARREISFTLQDDIYMRYMFHRDGDIDLLKNLLKYKPIKIDIGAVYEGEGSKKYPEQREIVFDIDMTDYDEVRKCCTGAAVCKKCWKFMVIACKILDTALREDFGFKHILWVFSGRRGMHCWVCDDEARRLNNNERSAIAEYLNVIKGGSNQFKKVQFYNEDIHHSLERWVPLLEKFFEEEILIEQDILNTKEDLNNFLLLIDNNIRDSFKDLMMKEKTSKDKWNAFNLHYKKLSMQKSLPKNSRNLVKEIIFQYTYPRLDINVTKSLNHLLKAPFCVHPKTGKICVPFLASNVEKLDPTKVPSINLLLEEINKYDEQTKIENETVQTTDNGNEINQSESQNLIKIRDYKKTSLLKPVSIFEKFIKDIQKEITLDTCSKLQGF